MSSRKKTSSPQQQGSGLWDSDGSVLSRALPTEEEKYLFVDPARGIKIPRVEYYYRPSEFVDPAQYRGRALRSQSEVLLLTGMTAFHYALAFVLYSGGNDSSMATHFAARFLGKNAAVCEGDRDERSTLVLPKTPTCFRLLKKTSNDKGGRK